MVQIHFPPAKSQQTFGSCAHSDHVGRAVARAVISVSLYSAFRMVRDLVSPLCYDWLGSLTHRAWVEALMSSIGDPVAPVRRGKPAPALKLNFLSHGTLESRDLALDAPALLFGRGNRQPELLLQRTREDAAHGVALPTCGICRFIDGRSLGSPQHRDDLVLFRRALCVRFRLRVRQRLDGRPQLIDQRLAVADLPALFGTGQSIPQRQQPLAIKRSGMQFLLRGDGNLALIHCRRRLAAQRDSIIADDVDAHGRVLRVVTRGRYRGGPTLTLSSPSKATLFRIILWRR